MYLTDFLTSDTVSERLIDRLAYSRDASIYRLVPRSVVKPKNESDIISLLRFAQETGTSVTFRAAGTSLSGQSVGEGIIAEVAHAWQDLSILENGSVIKLQPGVIGEHANKSLASYQRRIGPDPASIKAARIGGIVANNSSGMLCGIQNNSYHTIAGIRFVLANGNIYDTSIAEDYQRFIDREESLAKGILQLRDQIISNQEIAEKIRYKYRLKNTLGYSLNSFLDYKDALDIFSHLLIGSEGTLAFISNVTLKTVPDPPYKSTGLLVFQSMAAACSLIPFLREQGANAVELMDYASLTTAKYLKNPPYDISSLASTSSALLCEFQRASKEEIAPLVRETEKATIDNQGQIIGGFSQDSDHALKLWQIRKGLYPAVGSLRAVGTSVVTEDLCYDVENLAEAVTDLQRVFNTWKFDDAIIFGHAKDGNIHFVTSIDLESTAGIKRYDGMLREIVDLTSVKYNGALKAEHGTGRNMAPFVQREWGNELYEIMWRIKNLADPNNILNPDVLLNRNDKLHIESLKPIPKVDKIIDLCVECGFCEPVCPSRALTLSPRQRIVVARELKALQKQQHPAETEVMNDFLFSGEASCAVDGLCETACPVNINTGTFIKKLRATHHSRLANRIAEWTVDHFGFTQTFIRSLITVLKWNVTVVGDKFLTRFSALGNSLSGRSIPVWNQYLPGTSPKYRSGIRGSGKEYIGFSACVNRVFSADEGNDSIAELLGHLAELSGISLIFPEKISAVCCGMTYSSKGYKAAYKKMIRKTLNVLYEVSDYGRIPIVIETSSCTLQFQNMVVDLSDPEKKIWQQLRFYNLFTFLHELIENQNKDQLKRQVILHPTCASQKMGTVQEMIAIARHCASDVIVPDNLNCCGFAGDRGLLVPELTRSATKDAAQFISKYTENTYCYSSGRSCEIGMTSATNQQFKSIAYLVRDYLTQ